MRRIVDENELKSEVELRACALLGTYYFETRINVKRNSIQAVHQGEEQSPDLGRHFIKLHADG